MNDCGVRLRERIYNGASGMPRATTPLVIAKPVRTLAVAISEPPNPYKPVRFHRLPLRGRHAQWSCPTKRLSHPHRRARPLGAPVQELPTAYKPVRLYRAADTCVRPTFELCEAHL